MSSSILFQGKFDVSILNQNGKKFERVNRLHCTDPTFDLELVVDVNSEMFDPRVGQRLDIAMASSLSDGDDDGHFNPNAKMASFVDNYSYVMHGRVFSIKHIEKERIELQASFGGLLLRIKGQQKHLEQFSVDMMFFMLMKIIQ